MNQRTPVTFYDDSEFKCPKCEFKSTEIQPCIEHVETHSVQIANLPQVLPFLNEYLVRILDEKAYNDEKIRLELQKQKLTQVLAIQHSQKQTKSSCLFCFFVDSKQHLFDHLFTDHGMYLGKLDNLVQIDRYLKLLRTKLDQFECLYCEKIFRDGKTLRSHMRKKKHFRVNPKSAEYDCFYLKNYVDYELPDVVPEENYSSDSGDGSIEDWDEVYTEKAKCLVCPFVGDDVSTCLLHMKSNHQFDLMSYTDFYTRVKIVNYLRSLGDADSQDLMDRVKAFNSKDGIDGPWDDVKYLFAVIENDPLLMIDDGWE